MIFQNLHSQAEPASGLGVLLVDGIGKIGRYSNVTRL